MSDKLEKSRQKTRDLLRELGIELPTEEDMATLRDMFGTRLSPHMGKLVHALNEFAHELCNGQNPDIDRFACQLPESERDGFRQLARDLRRRYNETI